MALTSAKSAAPLTQADRLARKQELRDERAKLEARVRGIDEELAALFLRCDHTDADGRTAVVGNATKVCAHCGKTVARHADKLWQ